MQPYSLGKSRIALAAFVLGASLAIACPLQAQGCMPIRFTSPSLGAIDNSYLNKHEWQFGVAYRFLHADNFYIGHQYSPAETPGGKPIDIHIHTITLNATYALSRRLSLSLQLPFATGTESTIQPDGLRHAQGQTSIGDVSLLGNFWLLSPLDHARGNVLLTLGVKAPTGTYDGKGAFYGAPGVRTEDFSNNTIQTGDGGWGIALQTDIFQRVANRVSFYAAGSYLISPKQHIDYMFGQTAPVRNYVAVTDEYSAHAGFSYALLPRHGLTASLGGRVDGIPVHDLVGGGDQYFRRPGYAVYAEPGLSYTMARSPLSRTGSTFSISVPITVDRNRQESVAERESGAPGGGDFAKYLVFFTYSLRPR